MTRSRRPFSLCGAVLATALATMYTPTMAISLATNETATTPAPTAGPTTSMTSAAASTGSSSSTNTDRNTMIIIVACVAGVFAVAVVIAIVHQRRASKKDPPTPKDADYTELNHSAPTTASPHLRPRPSDAVSVGVKATAIHRPSQAYTERSTMASVPRDSEYIIDGKRSNSDGSDGDLAMLESYGQARVYTDGTFMSAVPFDDESSSRSVDVDSFRRQPTPYDTTLSNDSSMTYWETSDSMLDTNTSFIDADEPPIKRAVL